MMNGGHSIAVIRTLDGFQIMFDIYRKNMHVGFNVFKMICTFILLWNKILSSSSSILTSSVAYDRAHELITTNVFIALCLDCDTWFVS